MRQMTADQKQAMQEARAESLSKLKQERADALAKRRADPIDCALIDQYAAWLPTLKGGDSVEMSLWSSSGMKVRSGIINDFKENKKDDLISVDARTFNLTDGYSHSGKSWLLHPKFDPNWQPPSNGIED